MTHYERCKIFKPDRGYKSKATSLVMREWIDWYIKTRPISIDRAYTFIYHELLRKKEEYKGVHQHNTRALLYSNIRERIQNQYWFENQDKQIHSLSHHGTFGEMDMDQFINMAERALAQPKDMCNDKPLSEA